MLRPLSIHAMRQIEHQPCLNSPFTFPSYNIIVNYDRGPIGKIPKLRLPDAQNIRIGNRVSVLIPTNSVFTQMTVADCHLVGIQGFVEVVLFNVFLLVRNVGMTVGKCATLDVLARKT